MPIPTGARLERARRLRDLFEVQLRLTERVSMAECVPIHQLVGRVTNLHMRFGLGDIDKVPPSPEWQAYCDALAPLRTLEARADLTEETFACAAEEVPPAREAFGCFGFDPPDGDGVLRIHFRNQDSADGVGPLDRSKIPRRRAELAAMFARIAELHPTATAVQGGSWLYNLEAYRRLFPPAYGDSRRPPERARLSGTSSWGQFLDHTGAAKPDLCAALVRRLPTIDIAAPWREFPLPVLQTRAPIGLFHAFYEGATPTCDSSTAKRLRAG